MSSATQNNPKRAKETTKEGGISLTIMGQRSIYNSIHKPQRYSVQPGRNTKNEAHAHLLGNA